MTTKKNVVPFPTAPPREPGKTVFGTTQLEELELYRKWCKGYPDNRKDVP